MVAYILNPSTWEAVAQDYRDILSQCSPLPECFPTGAALCVCVCDQSVYKDLVNGWIK